MNYVDIFLIGYSLNTLPPFQELNYFKRDNHWGRRPHCHDYLQFLLVTKGTLSLVIGEDTFHLTPGYASIIPPGVIHEIYSTTGYEQIGANVYLKNPDDLYGLVGLLKDYVTRPVILELAKAVETADQYTHLLNASDRFAQTKAAQIACADLLEVLDCLQNDQQRNFSERLNCYLSAHLADGMKVEDVAREMHMSVSQLERVTRKCFGCGVIAAYNHKRIERARLLLSSSSLPINEIALKVGFTDPANFSNFFTGKVGVSPKQFRENHI